MGFTNPYPASRLTVDSTNSLGTGLLLWAPLTEGTGTTADCIVHPGHTGTQSGGVSWASDSIGSVASFDGVDDYFDFGTFSSYFPGPSITGSLSAWVKWFSGRGIVIGNQVTPNERLYIGVESGYWAAALGDYSWTNGNTGTLAAAVSGEWAHVVLSISSGVSKLYVNGTETITKTADTSVSLGGQFTVGAYFNSTGFALGIPSRIQNVRIYDRALSATEVATLYHRPWEGSNYGDIWPYSPPASTAMTLSSDTAATSLMTSCVGWWPLTEGSGSTATDLVGSNDGTLDTTVSFGTGELGTNAEFDPDGVNDGITTTYSPNGLSAISLSAWVRNDGGSASHSYAKILASDHGAASGGFDWMIRKSTNASYALYIAGTGNLSIASTTLPASGEWWHAAATWETGGNIKLYINGAEVNYSTQGSYTGSLTTTNNVEIGDVSDRVRPWSGGIQNVRVFSSALTADQIRLLYERPWEGEASYGDVFHHDPPAPASMLPLTSDSINTDQELWLPLTDGSSTTAVDISGGGNNGTLSGGVSWASTAKGTAADFGTLNDRINTANNIDFTTGTVSVWVYKTSTNKDIGLIGCGSAGSPSNDYDWMLYLGSTNGVFPAFYKKNNAGTASGAQTYSQISLNKWHNITITKDGTALKFYIDGVYDRGVTLSASEVRASFPFRINAVTSQATMLGNIQNVRLWSRALTAEEIWSIYATNPWLGSNYKLASGSTPLYNYIFRTERFRRLG